jgi:hypothetical protein
MVPHGRSSDPAILRTHPGHRRTCAPATRLGDPPTRRPAAAPRRRPPHPTHTPVWTPRPWIAVGALKPGGRGLDKPGTGAGDPLEHPSQVAALGGEHGVGLGADAGSAASRRTYVSALLHLGWETTGGCRPTGRHPRRRDGDVSRSVPAPALARSYPVVGLFGCYACILPRTNFSSIVRLCTKHRGRLQR